MRAAVVDRYGPPEVVRVAEVPRPEPASGQVLVRVHAAAVSSGDARIRAARFPRGFGLPARLALGITAPRRPILGVTFSGVIDAVGPGVERLSPGDRVSGMTGTAMGTHAEWVVVPVARAVPTPAGVSHDDAAGVLFGGTAALYFLRDRVGLGEGVSVLVIGASGAVGTNAVQLARHFGASVTAVCSEANLELVAGLGAERVIDRTQVDVTMLGDRFDVVMDTVGALSIRSGRPLVADGGSLVLVAATLGQLLRARGGVIAGNTPERADDVELLLDLVADDQLQVVHDSAFDLEDIVEAHRRVDTGAKRGNVLVHPHP